MLGGVPKAEAQEAKNKVDRIHDILLNTLFTVKQTDGTKAIWSLSELIDFVINLRRSGKSFDKTFGQMDVTYIDAHAAEILYGVKRRFKD